MLTSGKAILLVAISIVSGYAVLQASEFAFYNQLSNMVTATMVISAFFALFFLRALMMLFKPKFVFGDATGRAVRRCRSGGGRRTMSARPGEGCVLIGAAVWRGATASAQRGGAELSARDIMEKNFFVSKVSALQFEATMVLINHRGQQRERAEHHAGQAAAKRSRLEVPGEVHHARRHQGHGISPGRAQRRRR